MTQTERAVLVRRLADIGTLVVSVTTYDKRTVTEILDRINWLQWGIENDALRYWREAKK
jgi:hypothetical protein